MTVDPAAQLAFVPLLNVPDPTTGNSRIAIVNTAVDPDVADALKGTIVLSHPDIIASIALDPADGLLIVISGGIGHGGFVDLINESTGTPVTGSPFAMPKGADVYQFSTNAGYGQVVLDPVRKVAVIATLDDLVENNCSKPGACTGFTTFDLSNHTFTPIIQTAVTYNFGFDPVTDIAIPAGPYPFAVVTVVDIGHSAACILVDPNLVSFPEGVSIDSTTHIAVIGNDDGTATALNLFDSFFTNDSKPPCEFEEGGIPPNSVQVSGLPGATAGVAVNPKTHQAFLIEEDFLPTDFFNGIVLMGLPSAQVSQISAGDISVPAVSSLPFDPFGFYWQTQSEPFQIAVDHVHNMAYATGVAGTFLAQINLATFQSNPDGIATPLTTTTSCVDLSGASFGCNNQHGLIFYPLPPAFGD